MRVTVATLLAALALLAGCGGDAERESSPPPAGAPSTSTSDEALDGCATAQDGEIVEIPVEGGTLDGIATGEGRLGVVLSHQRGSNLCEWLPTARRLAAQGYSALAFDFASYLNLDESVAAAAAELRRRGASRIVLAGASMGGTAALVAARSTPGVVGVASLSGPELYSNLDAGKAVRALDVPLLLLAARGDGPFPLDARRLLRLARSSDKQLVLLPGSAHGTGLLAAARARRLFDSFVAQQAG